MSFWRKNSNVVKISPKNLSFNKIPPLNIEPHKPEALRLTNLTSLKDVAASDLPAHYTPSPLAVPSPNWHAVERYMNVAQTPKQLDK